MIPLMKMSNVLLFVLTMSSSLMAVVTSQQLWDGCFNPNFNRNQRLVQIQQPTRICFSIANDTDWNSGTTSYIRTAFEPLADVYSRFHIPNSYRDLVQRKNVTKNIFFDSTQITISAASQTALSYVRVYYDTVKDRVYPFLTAIMDVDRGVVRTITWDDACVFCGGTECVENTYNFNGAPQNQSSAGQITRSCFVSTEDCNALLSTNSSSTVCDLTIYAVWTGTDSNGIALQSQAYRFSEFPAQELSDRITQLLIPDAAADFINNSGENNDNTNTDTTNTNTTARNRLLSSSAAVLQVMGDHYLQSQNVAADAATNGAIHTAIINEEGDL